MTGWLESGRLCGVFARAVSWTPPRGPSVVGTRREDVAIASDVCRQELDNFNQAEEDFMSVAAHETANVGAVAVDELLSVITRVERLELKKAAIAADIRDVFAEAKGAGFDLKAIREIIKIRKVDAAVRESAIAMGMTSRQLLWQVELPLAAPIILAGVRVATVTTIGTATIAAAIGGGGLGVFIFRGIASVDTTEILAGAVPAALLALLSDGGLSWIEKRFSRA